MKSYWEYNGVIGVLRLTSVGEVNLGMSVLMFMGWFTALLIVFFFYFPFFFFFFNGYQFCLCHSAVCIFYRELCPMFKQE